MKYGEFDQQNKEYVIQRPNTPMPWSNYLGSADFGGVITNNAAGYTFYKSADQGRLTRFRFNSMPGDLSGRYLYLRDQKSGDFWSQSWMPVKKPLDQFKSECRHGMGYTVIRSDYNEVQSEVTYFVPIGATYEVWNVRLSNPSGTAKSLKLFPFVEPQCNWNATDDTKNLQYNQYISQTSYQNGSIDIGSNINMPEDPEHFTNKDQKRHTFFVLSGVEEVGFEADLRAFLGEYGDYGAPQAVVNGRCSGANASGDMPAAAFEIDCHLAPGEERWFALAFGVGQAFSEGELVKSAIATPEKVNERLEEVKQHWHSRLQTLSATTPDPEFDAMVNAWAPYNSLMTFYWSRTASLVYAGERDGLGFRDTLQDIVGSSALVMEESRERLELMLSGQYANGGCKPVVQPFNHRPGEEAEPDHYRSDDGMWFFNAVPAYVKESGDIDFYRKEIPYADKGQATVLGHMRRAIEFNLERSGQHGLPCGLHADWNDCLRLGEKGESLFVAMQLRYALREYGQICERLNENEELEWSQDQLKTLDAALDKYGWDGKWYLRAYRYDGLKFGSSENDEGRIFMNPQSWAVLSEHATGERAKTAMNSMHEHLATEYGIMVCTPPYVTTDPEVCLARLMNPGMKENGGVFNHTQGWAVMAAAKLGDGNRAWEYMRQVMPARFNEIAEIRQVEPYAVCQSTHSRFSARYGAGRVSWLSGSAVWNYVAMTTAILGIQPDYDGLCIDPCIPSYWDGFTAERAYRGAVYHIAVKNPEHQCKGVKSIVVNGEKIEGNRVPIAGKGDRVEVIVTLGS